jgi:3-isopropylmalate dehydratase small subunit
MDFTQIKLPIAVIGIIVAQAFGVIWYMSQQDSAVSELQETVVALEETVEEMGENLEEAVKTQAVITNEMRTIMSDHQGFGDTLREMGQSGALPSGERRAYGGY